MGASGSFQNGQSANEGEKTTRVHRTSVSVRLSTVATVMHGVTGNTPYSYGGMPAVGNLNAESIPEKNIPSLLQLPRKMFRLLVDSSGADYTVDPLAIMMDMCNGECLQHSW